MHGILGRFAFAANGGKRIDFERPGGERPSWA